MNTKPSLAFAGICWRNAALLQRMRRVFSLSLETRLQSRGRHPASRAPPLISNVRPRKNLAHEIETPLKDKMRRLLPATPTMRYERMALCIGAALICLLVCSQFTVMAMRATEEFSRLEMLGQESGGLRLLVLWAASGASGLCLIGFLVAAAIKLEVFQPLSRLPLALRMLSVARGTFLVAMALAVLIAVASVAA